MATKPKSAKSPKQVAYERRERLKYQKGMPTSSKKSHEDWEIQKQTGLKKGL